MVIMIQFGQTKEKHPLLLKYVHDNQNATCQTSDEGRHIIKQPQYLHRLL